MRVLIIASRALKSEQFCRVNSNFLMIPKIFVTKIAYSEEAGRACFDNVGV